jgi:hypothetical protein
MVGIKNVIINENNITVSMQFEDFLFDFTNFFESLIRYEKFHMMRNKDYIWSVYLWCYGKES